MENKKTILVVDGQGGGLGKAIIEKLREAKLGADIIAVGTNSIATGIMLRAGADNAATGENALVYNAGTADFIVGPIGIIAANSMLGEISPKMANAISTAPGTKLLIPLNKCNLHIAAVPNQTTITEKINDLTSKLRDMVEVTGFEPAAPTSRTSE